VFNLTWEFKLKPTATQIAVFEDSLEQCRKVYNSALKEAKTGTTHANVKLTLAPKAPSTLFLLTGPYRHIQVSARL
jgi:Helix-turn-helix domain.